MNLEGDKISTSRNWAVWLHEYLDELPDKQDVLRYVLAANGPETKDSEFTWKDFQTRNNSELVGIFGNFVNRAVVLTQKFCENKVPTKGELNETDKAVLNELAQFPDRIGQAIEQYRFREALTYLMDLARLGNKYLAETEPWKVAKTDLLRVNTILNIALQISASLSIVCEPFLPFTAEKLRKLLNTSQVTPEDATGSAFHWINAGKPDLLPHGHSLGEAVLLFEKLEDDVINQQINKLHESKRMNELATKTIPEAKPEIQYDDFAKMDIRIGTITEAERVPKSDKLLKLKVDDGTGVRQILSGIAKHFAPEAIIGKQVTFLANLAPRKMMGLESQGMILMAEDRDGSLSLIGPDKAVWNGGGVS
jgi:methionyl-tRNA synthetase